VYYSVEIMISRRAFLAAAAVLPSVSGSASRRPSLCVFSKHLAGLGYDELGATAKRLGFEGVDLTVRPGGHVLPERAAQDLPRAVEAIRRHGLQVPMITTGLTSATDPAAEPALKTAARLGIPFFKLGYWRYRTKETDPAARIQQVRQDLEGLVALARQHRIRAGFHNHSGDYVGQAVWDTRAILEGLDPEWIGYYYDPAHARIEGGLAGWQVSQQLVAPRLYMVAIKDFLWEKGPKGWDVRWCPVGQGMVAWDQVVAGFAAARFTGPLTLHLEYHTSDEPGALRADLRVMRAAVERAYP
jgi:L-ribulose-5-phosphate 3-epimerase